MGNCFVSKSSKKSNTDLSNDMITVKVDQQQVLNEKEIQLQPIEQENLEKQEIQIEVRQRKEQRNNKLLQGLINDTDQIVENIVKINKVINELDNSLIMNALEQHYYFTLISKQHKYNLIKDMFYGMVPRGQFVFKQGDPATSYFIIDKGSCEIIINEQVRKTIDMGSGFGEQALLYNSTRSASVRALEDSYFWCIDRRTFRKAVEELSKLEYEDNRKFLDSIKFFDMLSSDQKDSVAGVIISQQFNKGEFIVNEGDMANSYYIIKSGVISILKGGKELRKMQAGDSFGEQALYQNSVRGASVVVLSEQVKCMSLGREIITKIFGDKISVIMYNNSLRWAFLKHKILGRLTQIQIEKLVSNIETIIKDDGDIIYKKMESYDKIVIVLEGTLHQNEKQIVDRGGMYGDQYYTSEKNDKIVNQDIVIKSTNGQAKIGQINYNQFQQVIGGQLFDILKKNENSHESKFMKNSSSRKDDDNIKLEDMIYIKKLGFGQFGQVYLVRNKKNKQLYALKSIIKNQIIEQNLEKHLLQEKYVLESIEFPFIMQYIKPMKDQNYVYFLVEYIKGMELFDVIRDIGNLLFKISYHQGLLNTYDSQFYIGSLILCMEYLHMKQIIYRDIKPENIMVDSEGYLKLIDMGTAKFLNQKPFRTYTIIGTPHYMAPEIISGKGLSYIIQLAFIILGYTYNVDIWSIGICLFEFMCGGVPFAEDLEDPYEIYVEIVKKQINYPSFLKDRKARKLIDQLLSKTPELRNGGSFAALKANQWFDNFDWDKLMDKELKPPYIPPKEKLISEKDISKQEKQGKLIKEELKNEKIEQNRIKAKDPNWDKDF